MCSLSPTKIYSIFPKLTLEMTGKYDYTCHFKNNSFVYNDLRLTESKVQSIYENFNEMKYELFKMWVYNDIKYRNKIEFTLEMIEYLKNKEYYSMNDIDKLLLHIIYLELTQIKSNNI